MDNNRLILAVALSVAILLGFELVMPKQNRPTLHQQASQTTQTTPAADAPKPVIDPASSGNQPVAVAAPASQTRLPIDAPRVKGSIDLAGAKLDDLVLRDYHETVQEILAAGALCSSRRARIRSPTYIQLWLELPLTGSDREACRTSQHVVECGRIRMGRCRPGHPVTLTWNNGGGLTFSARRSAVDRRVHVRQSTQAGA